MLKLKHEIEIKDFANVGEGYEFLVMFRPYEFYDSVNGEDVMEGNYEDVIEFMRDVYCENNKNLSVEEILEMVEENEEDVIRIFFKEN